MRHWIPAILAAVLIFGPTGAIAAEAAGSFEVTGTVKRVEDDEVKIAREGKPTAELDVRRSTEILLDGKPATLLDLRPGQQIRASFELYGDDVVAVRIDARSTPAR